MKKLILTFAVVLGVMSPVFSEHVTVQTAQTAAQSFLNSKMGGNPQIQLIDFAERSSFPNFYVFGNDRCFVIISADDGAKPVLGYSTEGGFGADSLPDEVRDWLKAYNEEISSAMNLRVEATPRIRSEWEDLLSGRGLEPRSSSAVGPLITTHWHQYAPYNNLCPADPNASTGHAKAGCGAIAMAQFMNYWQHPVSGVGEYSYTPSNHPEYGVQYANFGETVYDWANMRDDYSNGYNDAEALAVATLVYHCGVSVNMNYGPAGSACNSSVIDDALMTYFDYSPNSEYVFKETSTDTIPDEIWIAMLKFNLDMQWPLIYRGQTEFAEGHIFICDGYDNNDCFHINWGHGGGADGYFAIGSLYENWTDYSYNNAAIFYSIPNYLYNVYNNNDPLIYSFNFDSESVTLKVKGHVDGEAATGTLIIPETKTFNDVTLAVTEIGEKAFQGCNGFMGSLSIPNSITKIENYAFDGCNGFTGNLTIPNSVTEIGYGAFRNCNSFTNVLAISNTVTVIGGRAFEGCAGFSGTLSIPNSCTTIGVWAFSNCRGISSVAIGEAVSTIGYFAFSFCSSLTSVVISNSVTRIGSAAFYYCDSLEKVYYTGNIAHWCQIEFEDSSSNPLSEAHSLYIDNNLVTNLNIPETVLEIKNNAFYGCNSFTSIQSLAETAPVLGNDAFYGVNHDIPVTVPCGSLASYQNASGWSEFTNIQEDCTSIFDVYNTDVRLFPNPVSHILTIEGEDIQRVVVYDAAGQMLEDMKTDGQDTVCVDVNNYTTGVYVAKIFIVDGVAIKRFVKQ